MRRLLSSFILMVFLVFYGCLPVNQATPKASRSDYVSLLAKGVVYLREADTTFQTSGVMNLYKLNQAEAVFSLAKELRPGEPEAIDGIGSVFLRKGDIQTARVLFQQCVKLDPQYARAYVHLAYLEEIEGRPAISRELLKTALGLNPKDYHALNNLGGIMYDAPSQPTDKEQGKKMLIQAIEIGDKDSVVLEHNRKIISK